MYTYKRFRISKSAVIIILMALALVAWGILGLTDMSLARKGGTAFKVTLFLGGVPDPFHGTAYLSGLGVNFFKLPPGAPDNLPITVGGVLLELQAMSVRVRAREILGVILQFKGSDGFSYFTDCDPEIKQWQIIPVASVDYVEDGNLAAGFTIRLDPDKSCNVPVCRHSGLGGNKEGDPVLGIVEGVGDPIYTSINE